MNRQGVATAAGSRGVAHRSLPGGNRVPASPNDAGPRHPAPGLGDPTTAALRVLAAAAGLEPVEILVRVDAIDLDRVDPIVRQHLCRLGRQAWSRVNRPSSR